MQQFLKIMEKFGLINNAPIPFESHLENQEENIKQLLLYLRDYIQSLGDNVIEEVRPHRIVYAKSLSFRYFLDVQPRKDNIVITIKKNRKSEATEYQIKSIQEIDNIKSEIIDGYTKI